MPNNININPSENDYNLDSGSQSSTNEILPSKPVSNSSSESNFNNSNLQTKKNNKPLFIVIACLAVLSIAGGAVGYNYFSGASSKGVDNSVALNSKSLKTTEQKVGDIFNSKSQELAQNTTNQTDSPQNSAQNPAQNTTTTTGGDTGYEMGAAGTEKTAGEIRERIERYMQIANQNTEESGFDIVNLSKEQVNNINNNQVPTISLSKEQTKTKTLKVQYSNLGDQEFMGGEIVIKIDSGIKISKQNLNDVFKGETKALPESVFVSDNEIRIPKDKIAVGGTGYIELTLELGDVAPGEYILRSILKEKDTGKGIPGFGYIKVE